MLKKLCNMNRRANINILLTSYASGNHIFNVPLPYLFKRNSFNSTREKTNNMDLHLGSWRSTICAGKWLHAPVLLLVSVVDMWEHNRLGKVGLDKNNLV